MAITLKQETSTAERRQMARIVFKSITLSPTGIRFVIRKQALIQHLLPGETETTTTPDSTRSNPISDDTEDATIIIEHHIALKRRGVEARIVIGATSGHNPDPALIELIARAHHYLNRLTDGSVSTIGELATALSIHRAEISRILPLAFLSPSITEAILTGRQPVDLAARALARLVDIPASWSDQARALGM